MKTKIFLTTALVCSFFICLAAVTGLNGKWGGTVKVNADNELALTYNFKVDGDKLTGSVISTEGTLPISDGVLSGTDFTFNVEVGSTTISHSGKYYGDSVVVSANVAGETFHSRLTRVGQ